MSNHYVTYSFGKTHMYVLVVSKELNFRRLIVANLVIRGHLAVGVSSVQEAQRLIENVPPRLVVLSKARRISDDEMRRLRESNGLGSVPLLLISAESPDTDLMRRWDIREHVLPRDVREMVDRMSPWLAA